MRCGRLIEMLVAVSLLGGCSSDATASLDAATDVQDMDVPVPYDVQYLDVPSPYDYQSPPSDLGDRRDRSNPPNDLANPRCDGDGGTIDVRDMARTFCICDSIVGTYRAQITSGVAWFRFGPDGSWSASPTEAGLRSPVASGRYSVRDNTLSISDNVQDGDVVACPAGLVGTYEIEPFNVCEVFTLRLRHDDCASRAASLADAPFGM